MIVTVQEMIEWLRAESEDAYLIESLIDAAVKHVENETGMHFGASTEITQTSGPGDQILTLRGVPVEGEDFTIERWAGESWESVEASAYYVDGSRVIPAAGRWRFSGDPAPRLRVRYTAGWTDGLQPTPVQLAGKLLVGHWYENREAVVVQGAVPHEVPLAVDRLLAPYRRVVV